MKKALFLYSGCTGGRRAGKRIAKAIERLSVVYDLETIKTESQEELISRCASSCGAYDLLIIGGGDGSFHHAVNAVKKQGDAPILGFLNVGTMGDVGRVFGIGRTFQKNLRILESGHFEAFDLGKINQDYFVYMAAVGAYSDVSYTAKRKRKEKLGRFVYYWLSVKEAFRKIRVKGSFVMKEERKGFNVPFLLILNGTNVGGFKVGKGSDPQDGKLEFFLTPEGIFNGLLHYFLPGRNFEKQIENLRVSLENECKWCLDGECKTMDSEVCISVEPNGIRVLCDKK